MEQFATNDFFLEKECMQFLNTHFDNFLEGALFKIKKHLIPCMLAISKHTSYDVLKSKIISQYVKFTNDPIWGVRRVSVEIMPKFIEKLKPSETKILI